MNGGIGMDDLSASVLRIVDRLDSLSKTLELVQASFERLNSDVNGLDGVRIGQRDLQRKSDERDERMTRLESKIDSVQALLLKGLYVFGAIGIIDFIVNAQRLAPYIFKGIGEH